MLKYGVGATFIPSRKRWRNHVSSVSESTLSLKSKLLSRLSMRIFSWMSKTSLPSKKERGLGAGGGGVAGALSAGPARALALNASRGTAASEIRENCVISLMYCMLVFLLAAGSGRHETAVRGDLGGQI